MPITTFPSGLLIRKSFVGFCEEEDGFSSGAHSRNGWERSRSSIISRKPKWCASSFQRSQTLKNFSGLGFEFETVNPVVQQTCSSLKKLAARIRLRADTTLSRSRTSFGAGKWRSKLERSARCNLTRSSTGLSCQCCESPVDQSLQDLVLLKAGDEP